MTGVPAVHLLVEHQQREVDHPEEIELVGRDGHLAHLGKFLGAVEADFAEDFAGVEPFVGGEQDEIALFDAHFFLQGSLLGVTENFDDRRFPLAVFDLDVGQTLGTEALGIVGHGFHLALGDTGEALGVEHLDHAALGHHAAEDLEFARGKVVGHVDDLHVEPRVRLVDAPAVHHFLERDARERGRDVDVERGFPDALQQALDQVVNILPLDERHLNVDLCEFRLAIGPQILVAITAGELKVFVHPGAHEDLLVLLRRLGQGVKLAGVDSAGDEEFPRALRRALEQGRRLDFEEALFLHEHPRGGGDPAAQTHVVDHLRSTQVEVAMLEAQLLVHLGRDLGVVDGERQHVGVVEHFQFVG